jgi:uncharacterized protein YjeT (DUF2065 family)
VKIDWSDLLAALGLLLVLEGILPFLNPNGTRRLFTRLATVSSTELRAAGCISLVLGLVVLYFVRSSS